LPGKSREGWTLNIVLDTSGSMDDAISRALGAIDQFCQANDVESVRILQCDVEVTSDEYVEVGSLERFEAKGFGGSDMSPAMLKLAEEPDVEAVIVLTDGGIDYPEGPMPYETLWCIVEGWWSCDPRFPYGTVVRIDLDDQD
jgi:predicted metal-dependent peptidase